MTFLVSAVLVRVGLRARPAAFAGSADMIPRPGWLRSLGSGGHFAFADRGARVLVLMTWLMAVITVYEGLAAPYAAALGGGSATVGLLLAGDPIGGVLGAYLFSRWVPPDQRPLLTGPLAVIASASLILCLLRPGIIGSTLLFVVSGGLGTVVVMQATTTFMVAVPDARRGQVLGLSNTGLTMAARLSPLVAGVVADHLGTAATVGWFGLAGLALVTPLALIWRRIFRDDPRRWDPQR